MEGTVSELGQAKFLFYACLGPSSILKSFLSEVTRTATLLFEENTPQKGFCECTIGKCGLCCHVIVIPAKTFDKF